MKVDFMKKAEQTNYSKDLEKFWKKSEEKGATFTRERSTCYDECLKKANGCAFRDIRVKDIEDNAKHLHE